MPTAADILIESLLDWGVGVVFGLPGDGINGIMEALRKRQDEIRFVQVRHEESAAFMATAYAKYTGKLGVCLGTSGPGAIHLLNGLYDAKLDGAPVLALTGQTYHDLLGSSYQQEVGLEQLFSDVAVYNQRVMGPTHVAMLADIACRTALARRAVAHISFPVDLQEQEYKGKVISKRKVLGHTSDVFACPIVIPTERDLARAADLLNAGERIVILAGRGALDAGAELEELAEKLGAPIIKALLGKAVVPDDSPYNLGTLGLLGTRPAQEAIEQCDTLLMVGTSFPYMQYLPEPGEVRAVQIDISPTKIGIRYPVEVGLVGEACETLRLLIPMVQRRADRSFLEQAQRGMQEWWRLMDVRAARDDLPLKPQVVAKALSELAAPNAIISTDSGTITTWIARHFVMKRGQMFSLSGNLATMACGLPYAIAAQVAYPDRQSIAFIGDGGFSMLMAEMATAVKYNLPIKVIVIKNNTLGQIKWEQMVFLGNPEYGCELHPIDFVKFAEACGATGIHVERPEEVRPALERALAASGPVLVEALVDPFEPPMPPKVDLDQALKFAESLARGEPNRGRIALTLFRNKISELRPGESKEKKPVEKP